MIVMAAATFMALYIPLGLQLELPSILFVKILYWTSSVIFLIDVYIRYDRSKKEQAEGETTSGGFLIGWLLVDVLAAIPFGLIFGGGYFQLIRLVKLVRVAQFIRRFKQAEVRFSISLTLISFVYWALLLIHLLACGWMGVYGIKPDLDAVTSYISSMYWTVTTLTSVGYGDILPVTNPQRLYAMLVQITGIGVFGYLIGNVVTILTKLDISNTRYKDHVEHLSTATKRRGLSKNLQRRVLDYYRYLRDETTGYDESAFLQTLPESLRTEVALNLKKEFIEGIPLFKNANERFVIDIALRLELIVATPRDDIFKANDPASAMYFVISGELEVLNKKEDRILAKLKSGDFFGEIALVKNIPRSATVRATSYCNLYKLKRKTFKAVLVAHPEIAAQIEELAKFREERYFEE
jgi:voltage-gated potassium channel